VLYKLLTKLCEGEGKIFFKRYKVPTAFLAALFVCSVQEISCVTVTPRSTCDTTIGRSVLSILYVIFGFFFAKVHHCTFVCIKWKFPGYAPLVKYIHFVL
jgi:hypothetical protein